MTKVAVLISGQPRAFEASYKYLLENVLSIAECDVFIHTWRYPFINYERIWELYKPVAMTTERELTPEFYEKYSSNVADAVNHPAKFTFSMFRSIYKSWELMDEYSPRYDWVIKTRFDFAINAKIPWDQLNSDKLYVPSCRMTPERDFCNDQWALGSPRIMERYCQTFLHMDDFYRHGVRMNGEDMLSANLKRQRLVGEKLIYVDMNHPFPAGPYNGGRHSLIRDEMDIWQSLKS